MRCAGKAPVPLLRSPLLLLALPALAAAALNAPTVTDVFQGDDASFVVRHRQNGPDFLLRAFTELHIGIYYRPVADLAFFLQQKAFDDYAPGWHATSVALHAAVVLALAAAVLALTRRPIAAFLAAGLFALTPTYTGSVAWVANQTELLAALFASVALALFVTAVRGQPRPLLLAGGAAAYALACGAKEVGATVLVPMAAYLALRSWERGLRPGRSAWRDVAAAAAPLLPFLVVVGLWAGAQLYLFLVVRPPLMPFYHAGPHMLETLRYEALRLILPVNSGLMGIGALDDPTFGTNSLLGYLAQAAVLGICLAALIRGPAGARALALWLAVAMVPISLWEPGFANARYLYTPALAFCGLMAAGALPLAERLFRRPGTAALAAAGLLALLAVPYGAGTVHQNRRVTQEGRQETAFLRQLEALDPAVPPGTTIYLVDTPWNGLFSPAEPMAQMRYGPSVRVVKIGEADVAEARRGATGPTLFLGMRDGRLAVLPAESSPAAR